MRATFGQPVVLRSPRRALTPIGSECAGCGEAIAAEDAGAYLASSVVHEECFVRSIWGSVGHQRGECSCFGGPGTMDDPPGLTRRQSAKAALDEYLVRHGRHAPMP